MFCVRSIDCLTVKRAELPAYDASFVLSAATPDRVKDTIDPAAYDVVATKSPRLIALFNHDPNQIAGQWENVRRAGDTLQADIKFSTVPVGAMLKTLINEGVPLGASIGFRGKGEIQKSGGVHFTDIEILETSVVSVPAHPRAVQIAKAYGFDLTKPARLNPLAPSGFDGVITAAHRAIIRAKITARG